MRKPTATWCRSFAASLAAGLLLAVGVQEAGSATAATGAPLSAGATKAGSATAAKVVEARGAAVEPVPDLNPEPTVARLAYVTESARSPTSRVWLASASGTEPKMLGLGDQPLLAPNGQSVAASLFGSEPGAQESGPSIAIYSATGAPTTRFLSLETATATPLAWSPDSRYLAVYRQSNALTNIAASSGLDVIDTQTGAVTSIAEGAIFGASFARDGSDRLVFALAHSLSGKSTNLYLSNPDGSGRHRLTSDGHSLDPVWGPRYIAYDRERLRSEAPIYQIWLATPSDAHVRRLTHGPADPLVEGLAPLAFCADGNRLLAEFVGQDTSAAWTVEVASGRAREVRLAHHRLGELMGAGISQDGSTLLLDQNALERAPSEARIVTMPFTGGAPHVLVAHGAEASWND